MGYRSDGIAISRDMGPLSFAGRCPIGDYNPRSHATYGKA